MFIHFITVYFTLSFYAPCTWIRKTIWIDAYDLPVCTGAVEEHTSLC